MKKILVKFLTTLVIFILIIYGFSSDTTREVVNLKEINDKYIVVENEDEIVKRIESSVIISNLLEEDTQYKVIYSQRKLSKHRMTLIEIEPYY